MDDNANAADAGQADASCIRPISPCSRIRLSNGDTTVLDQSIVTAPACRRCPTAPTGQFDQDMQHLMIHLGDLKAFLMRFEHKVEGKIGEIVAFLKENL